MGLSSLNGPCRSPPPIPHTPILPPFLLTFDSRLPPSVPWGQKGIKSIFLEFVVYPFSSEGEWAELKKRPCTYFSHYSLFLLNHSSMFFFPYSRIFFNLSSFPCSLTFIPSSLPLLLILFYIFTLICSLSLQHDLTLKS